MALSLPELDRVERDKLVDRSGRSFKEVRRGMTPRFARVWFDILAGYLVLGLTCAAIVFLDGRFPRSFPLIALGGGLVLGYVIAYLELFFHEAAHFNLAPTRRLNDFLANLLIGLPVGQSIKAYRVVHMDHHRLLGTSRDTERSYFDALDLRFIFESLSGIKLVRVLLARRALVGNAPPEKSAASSGRGMMLAGLALNLSILGTSAALGCWSMFFAWPFGLLVVHTAINAIRQLLEHRSYDAKSDADYRTLDHGAVTRMFGTGPISSTLGGAGFNRHLLHHWDPQLSYTRFAELEAFLLETDAAETLRNATTTYPRALITLLRAP